MKQAGPVPPKRAPMRLTLSTRVAFGSLLALHLVSAVVAMGLLSRMEPAIERIIARNVVSLEAVEHMLQALADPGRPAEERRAVFEQALSRAENNVTQEAERPLLGSISGRRSAALAGEPGAVTQTVTALGELARVNRAEIERSDVDAKRLSSAGAWVVSFLALFTLGVGVLGLRRFDRLVLAPIEELHGVLHDHNQGQQLRRCSALNQASAELHESMLSLNQLLDARDAEAPAKEVLRQPAAPTGVDRASLLAVLDRMPQPYFVLDSEGEVVAANRVGFEQLSGDAALLRRLRFAVLGEAPKADGADPAEPTALDASGIQTEQLADTGRSLVWLEA